MRLDLIIAAPTGADPTSPTVRDAVDTAAARQAVSWTAPVYVGTVTPAEAGYPDSTDITFLRFTTDALPRSAMVTTANVAPPLLPPHVQ